MKRVAKIISILKRRYKPKFFEKRRNPFHVLVSCLLSTRTKDEVSWPASDRLLNLAKTPKQMLKVDTKKIEKAIYPVGFYKTKARTIKKLCKKLIREHNSKVPPGFDELMKLPGIGRKCANITLIYGFNVPTIAIDTHCHRIPNRIGLVKTKTPEETEKELKRFVPKKHWIIFNELFVRFGQAICLPVKPKCQGCPIKGCCYYCKRKIRH